MQLQQVSQIKEQLEAVDEELDNEKIVIIEWPPRIMGFIHLRNVFQKEVITFSRLREEEEARLIRREEKMGATEDQALMIQRRSRK